MDNLFETCGYLATFIGTMLEGELSLTTSMIGAKMGYYNLSGAMIFAFLGAWVADWFKYLVGKTKGQAILKRKPNLQSKIDKVTVWFEKYPYLVLTGYKFLFGTTTVILLLAGLKNVSYVRFAIHTGISVALWVLVIGGFGYFCAETLTRNIELFSMYKVEVIGTLSAIAFLYWLIVKRPYQNYCLFCEKGESVV